jgi:hypothetical protein
MPKTIFDIGETFEKLTVIAELPRDARSRRWYLVRCDCGNERAVCGANLRPGNTVSCGCYRSRMASVTHGDASKGARSAEYTCWTQMKQRCSNPNKDKFHYYGGRGISVCQRWINSYESFLADMGRKPSAAHSIDRVDVNGDYEPSNCRWATSSEQIRNRRKPPAKQRISRPWDINGVSRTTWYRKNKSIKAFELASIKKTG